MNSKPIIKKYASNEVFKWLKMCLEARAYFELTHKILWSPLWALDDFRYIDFIYLDIFEPFLVNFFIPHPNHALQVKALFHMSPINIAKVMQFFLIPISTMKMF